MTESIKYSVIRHPSSVFRHLSSVFCHPSSVICHPSSVFCHPSSVLRPLSSVFCPLPSALGTPLCLCAFAPFFRFIRVRNSQRTSSMIHVSVSQMLFFDVKRLAESFCHSVRICATASFVITDHVLTDA